MNEYIELFMEQQRAKYVTSGEDLDWCINVDHDRKWIKLFFQETTCKIDWKNNFRFTFKVYKNQVSNIKTHKGYSRAYKSANDEVMRTLLNILGQYPYYRVMIIGYSFGGGVSQLAAEDLNFRTRKNIKYPHTGVKARVITYGSPRAFHRKCHKYVLQCCDSVIQIGHRNDIVTIMPPGFLGYENLYLPKALMIGDTKFNFFRYFNAKKYHACYKDEIHYKDATLPSLYS